MNVVVCTPWRASDPHRIALWGYVRTHLAACGFDVVEGDSDGEFNRAAARNHAARTASALGADVLLFSDADMLLRDRDAYLALADLAADGEGLVIGFDTFHYVSQPATRRALSGGNPWQEPRHHRTFVNNGTMWCPVGGITAVTPQAWNTVGGMDERFRLWGCEDTALDCALETMLGPRRRVEQPALHLHHPWAGHRKDPANSVLHERYGQARGNPTAMRALLTEPGGPLDRR